MDFFETREKYRRKEYRIYISLLVRVSIFALVLWIGWQWGNYDQKNLYENINNELNKSQAQLNQLNQKIVSLIQKNKKLAAENTISELGLEQADKTISTSIKFLLESEVSLEQIRQTLLAKKLAVATELYTGAESSLSLFQGGLLVHVNGAPFSQGNKNNPWFDPEQEIEVRLAYLGGQKIVTGSLPVDFIIPAETWLLKAQITKANLRGYVRVTFNQCSLR